MNCEKYVLIFFLIFGKVQSQSINEQKNQLWIGLIINTKISNHYNWWNDAHLVLGNFGIIRTGLTYNFNNKYQNNLTAGIAYAIYNPLENQTEYGKEWRPWLQSSIILKANFLDYLIRLRYEARFRAKILENTLQNEFNFNHRIRMMLQARHYFGDGKKYFWMVSDEVLFNAGNTINHQIRMDQNRISLGIGYKYKQTTFQIDYMNQMILSNKNYNFIMNPNFQILVFQNLNFDRLKNVN